jgi:hypothetical protein
MNWQQKKSTPRHIRRKLLKKIVRQQQEKELATWEDPQKIVPRRLIIKSGGKKVAAGRLTVLKITGLQCSGRGASCSLLSLPQSPEPPSVHSTASHLAWKDVIPLWLVTTHCRNSRCPGNPPTTQAFPRLAVVTGVLASPGSPLSSWQPQTWSPAPLIESNPLGLQQGHQWPDSKSHEEVVGTVQKCACHHILCPSQPTLHRQLRKPESPAQVAEIASA